MNKLIRNEWRKLFHRKSFYLLCVLILLVPAAAAGMIKYNDDNIRVSWKQEYHKEMEHYNRLLSRSTEFDEKQWENELSWKADLVTWQNCVQKYQFCIDNNIPSWDWRMEVVEQYFRNLLLLNCIRDGWNTADLSQYLGYDQNIDLQVVETENQNMMVYCLTNDYSTYNKEQLMKAETNLVVLQDKAWIEDAQKTLGLAENEVEKWENYLSLQVPPYAKDNWISLCIEDLKNTKDLLTEYRLMNEEEIEAAFLTQEVYQVKISELEAREAKDRFVLQYKTPTVEMLSMAYVEKSSYLDYFELIFRLLALLPVLGILFAGMMITGEYKQNTMKQLVMYPFKRRRILHSKILTAQLLMLVLAGVVMMTSGLIAVFMFNMNLGNLPVFASYQNGIVFWVWYPVYVLLRFIFAVLVSWLMIALTSALAVMTRSSSFSILASLVSFAGLPALIKTIYLPVGSPVIFKFILFGNLEWNELLTNNLSAPYAQWWQTLVAVIGWWVVLRVIAAVAFTRQDIFDK